MCAQIEEKGLLLCNCRILRKCSFTLELTLPRSPSHITPRQTHDVRFCTLTAWILSRTRPKHKAPAHTAKDMHIPTHTYTFTECMNGFFKFNSLQYQSAPLVFKGTWKTKSHVKGVCFSFRSLLVTVRTWIFNNKRVQGWRFSFSWLNNLNIWEVSCWHIGLTSSDIKEVRGQRILLDCY